MEITNRFPLPLDAEGAFRVLLDLEQVAPCMPGATLGSEREDGGRDLVVTVRLGPIKLGYAGSVRIAEQDAAARRAVLVGSAREQRGQGTATATITMTVAPNGSSASLVESVAQIELTGRAAQSGRGIVEDVSRQMVADMARCLAARCEAAQPPAIAGAPAAAPTGPGPTTGTAQATAGGAAPATAAATPPADAAPTAATGELRAGRLLLAILRGRIAWLLRRGRRA
jgi:carbon monoxide dehydrogenase subunit G